MSAVAARTLLAASDISWIRNDACRLVGGGRNRSSARKHKMNYTKSFSQMLRLLYALDCEVDFVAWERKTA